MHSLKKEVIDKLQELATLLIFLTVDLTLYVFPFIPLVGP